MKPCSNTRTSSTHQSALNLSLVALCIDATLSWHNRLECPATSALRIREDDPKDTRTVVGSSHILFRWAMLHICHLQKFGRPASTHTLSLSSVAVIVILKKSGVLPALLTNTPSALSDESSVYDP